MYKSFEEKKPIIKVERKTNKKGVRKPNIDPSTVGGEIKKPIHLKEKKKELLKEKAELLKRKNSKKKGL